MKTTDKKRNIIQNNREPVFYSCGGIEIYRLYNPNDGDHLLTTSWNEREKLRKLGWIPEDNASLKTLKKE